MLKRIKGTVDKASGKKISGSKQPWYQPWEESGEQPTRQPMEESGEQPTRQPKEEPTGELTGGEKEIQRERKREQQREIEKKRQMEQPIGKLTEKSMGIKSKKQIEREREMEIEREAERQVEMEIKKKKQRQKQEQMEEQREIERERRKKELSQIKREREMKIRKEIRKEIYKEREMEREKEMEEQREIERETKREIEKRKKKEEQREKELENKITIYRENQMKSNKIRAIRLIKQKEEDIVKSGPFYDFLFEFGYEVEPSSINKDRSNNRLTGFKDNSEYFLALMIYKEDHESKEALDKFENEVEATKEASKDSNFVLPICDQKFSQELPGYSAAYVFAHPPILHDLFSKYESINRIKGKRIGRTLIQMALAVRNVHKKKIVHRDIALNTFYRMADGRIMLSGFSKALKIKDNQITGVKNEKAYYVPYDIEKSSSGKEEVLTKKFDVFSLGMAMILYIFGEIFEDCLLGSISCIARRDGGSIGRSFFTTLELFDRIQKFYKALEKYQLKKLDKKEQQLVKFIFTRMLIKLDEGGFLGKSRACSKEVLKELKEIYPKEDKYVERKYGDKTDHCNQEALE